MTVSEHQKLIQLIEITAVRAGLVLNETDKQLYMLILPYLSELIQRQAKELL